MAALIFFLLSLAASLFKSRGRLEAENAALRQQLIVLQRKLRGRVQVTNSDRLFFIQLYRWFPSVLNAITIIRPKTLVRWHRAGFRRYWRWKSRNLGGRPQISADLRALIRRMSVENLLWGAPRIHGELPKLGFAVAQSTVAKYMATADGRPVWSELGCLPAQPYAAYRSHGSIRTPRLPTCWRAALPQHSHRGPSPRRGPRASHRSEVSATHPKTRRRRVPADGHDFWMAQYGRRGASGENQTEEPASNGGNRPRPPIRRVPLAGVCPASGLL